MGSPPIIVFMVCMDIKQQGEKRKRKKKKSQSRVSCVKEVDPGSRPYGLCGHTATLKTKKKSGLGSCLKEEVIWAAGP